MQEVMQVGTEICFKVTEPSLVTGAPLVSEPKIGKITSVDGNLIKIELRDDFRLHGEEEELMLEINNAKYLGSGVYQLQLADFVGIYLKLSPQKRTDLDSVLATLKPIQKPTKVVEAA